MKYLILLLSLLVLPLWADPALKSKNEDLYINFDGSGTIKLTFQFTEPLPLSLKKRLWDRLSHAAEESSIGNLNLKTVASPPQTPSEAISISFHHINHLRDLLKSYQASHDDHNLDDKALQDLVETYLATGTYQSPSLTHVDIRRIITKANSNPAHYSFRLTTDIPSVTTNGKKETDGSYTWENEEVIDISMPWYVFIPRWIIGIIGGIITGSILSIIFILIKKKSRKNKLLLSQNDSNKEDKVAQVRQNDTQNKIENK